MKRTTVSTGVLIGLLGLASIAHLSCGSGLITIDLSPGVVYLDQVGATLTIRQTVGGAEAAVVAVLTGLNQRPYLLQGGQSLAVNGQSLVGPDPKGDYTRTVAAAPEYLVTVSEPAKFVKTTTIAPPDAFDITAPASDAVASLGGFTVTWSGANPDLKVELVLRQIIDGRETVRTYGPYDDSGTHTFSGTDLAGSFFWGKNLTLALTVTKIRQRSNVDGFKSGTLSVKLANSRTVTLGP